MLVNERLIEYINTLDSENSEILNTIEKEALRDNVPIVRKDMQAFLKFVLALKKPEKILEAGTAIGFSSILMGENSKKDCHITTIENYQKRINIAKENIKRAGMTEKITLLEGDALEVMEKLDDKYDMIFLDASKGQYINLLPQVMRLLKNDGIVISDNMFQDGDLIESRFAVRRRDRTIHKRIRDYIYEITHNESLKTVLLPVGDGVAFTTRVSN
ncbi:Predicted O-methyltransferase YrrM [Acetitomaculum ruminis DSM 5522]|uniref:tRNA 5-hydroxyuridine methyltransferase n=1 Tax=Acetitomaculum ruminis DSM 5522 TaxID=1120918 RepID=A0A1I0ZK95_9FIRM|nr:Predicted O-methyltransferase YrrM [Acetitomaculum ruminis DSM 5522]